MQNDCQPSQSDRSSASHRKALVAALVYLIASVIGTIVAIQRNLPAHVFTIKSTGPVGRSDFAMGTALSVPGEMLVILIALLLLASIRWKGRPYASLGIGVYGALSFLGSALEHIVPHVFNDLLLGLLVVMVSGSAFLMSIFGTCDYITERHRRQILRTEVGER
jgi:hypothetical protein